MAEPNDSGMASLDDSSKDVTPEKPKAIVADLSDDDEEFEDETFLERLIGLSEMFPESVVNFTTAIGSSTKVGVKGLYNFSRNTLWVVSSSALILFAPLVFEVERATLEESTRSQQKQFLLGPNAMPGSMGITPPR